MPASRGAEQANLTSDTSSTYACAGCCPDSFFNGWVTPGEVHGLPGDETQFLAVRQDQTCDGLVSDMPRVFG